MKLSFSTRGWHHLSWNELTETAEDMHFEGIELYDLFRRDDLTAKNEPFNRYNMAATARWLKMHSLEIPCFDTSCDILGECEEKLLWTIEAAGIMRVPYIAFDAKDGEESDVRDRLMRILEAGKKAGVGILIKTRGIYADTSKLRDLLDSFADDSLGVLWDMIHPYCDCGETPDTTIKNLGAYVRHVHLRDSKEDDGTYVFIGEGRMPVDEFMKALSSIDYDGFVSLEWKPGWIEDVQDYTFIFPHFVNYMSRYEDTRTSKRKLFLNHDGTGEYIWEKYDLIDLTFPQVLDRVVEEFPNQYAFKYTTLDYTRTYEEFRDDIDDFARALVSLGVKAGSKVAIWATNVPAWYITFWATTKIGAVLVTVNTAYKIHEAEYLFRQSDTHTIVMIEKALDSNYRRIINEICPEIKDTKPGEPIHSKRLPFLRNVITVGFRQKGCLTFEEAMDRAGMVPKEQILKMAAKVRPGDVCNMQ